MGYETGADQKADSAEYGFIILFLLVTLVIAIYTAALQKNCSDNLFSGNGLRRSAGLKDPEKYLKTK